MKKFKRLLLYAAALAISLMLLSKGVLPVMGMPVPKDSLNLDVSLQENTASGKDDGSFSSGKEAEAYEKEPAGISSSGVFDAPLPNGLVFLQNSGAALILLFAATAVVVFKENGNKPDEDERQDKEDVSDGAS